MTPLEQLAAKFATAHVPKYAQGSTGYVFTEEQLRRFLEQVIEEEHKRLLEVSGEAEGSAEVFVGMNEHGLPEYTHVDAYTADQLQAAVLRERERIAAFVEEQDVQHPKHIAAAIRSGA